MDLIVCKCAKCDVALGTMVNLWTQLGKNYMTPAAGIKDAECLRVETSGVVRLGDADTLIAGCQLQVAECAECHSNLGQKCLKSPTDHVLKDGQLIFRVTSINLTLASDTRRKVAPEIQRVLKLKVNGQSVNDNGSASPTQEESVPRDNHPTSELLQIQAELAAQRREISRIGSTGVYVVSSFETAIARVDQQIRQLNDSAHDIRSDAGRQRDALETLQSQKEDSTRVNQCEAIVARLDQQLQDTDKIVTELREALQKSQSESETMRGRLALTRQELEEARNDAAKLKADVDEAKNAAHESLATSREYACEISSLRREVKQLRANLDDERSRPPPTASSSISSHELDILASSISKIGNRASHVESLQMEFELFKTRLQRLEARADGSGAHPGRGMATTVGATGDGRDDESQPGYDNSNFRRKRAFVGRDDVRGFDKTSPKRAALSISDHDSGISTGCSRASDLYRSSSGSGKSASRPGPRRSRGGAEDYAAPRRESWSGSG
ncbi:hypothetical protein XA68_16674 [Ophiocordyceps unilateralis]|uniref:Yippee/Mis18/Cereblon domain-containing protein n=1 Tax=Ophiocordyceps unilateralis TaxID=268505 RepID=A0A2A9PKA8_OPHUN|nr:hypothetical protein XA68_16674 [Ophiocordyceps unilateralis]